MNKIGRDRYVDFMSLISDNKAGIIELFKKQKTVLTNVYLPVGHNIYSGSQILDTLFTSAHIHLHIIHLYVFL